MAVSTAQDFTVKCTYFEIAVAWGRGRAIRRGCIGSSGLYGQIHLLLKCSDAMNA